MPALNDEEVLSEMKKMVAFIKQEAQEKAREIHVKADEEFAIEKGKIVRQETTNIDGQYERKRKQVEIQKKIASSNQNNKSRLKLLSLREELLEESFDDARKRVKDVTNDQGKYQQVLEQLILQCLYSLMEPEAKVSVRNKDMDIAKKASDSAAASFKDGAGFEVKLSVSGDLPAESAGGVLLTAHNNRIKIDNTLDERLKLLEELMLPELRESLFGRNENRKHYN